jgi:hypothetical protein
VCHLRFFSCTVADDLTELLLRSHPRYSSICIPNAHCACQVEPNRTGQWVTLRWARKLFQGTAIRQHVCTHHHLPTRMSRGRVGALALVKGSA